MNPEPRTIANPEPVHAEQVQRTSPVNQKVREPVRDSHDDAANEDQMTTETSWQNDQAQPRKNVRSAIVAALSGAVAGVLLAQAVKLQYAPPLVGWVVVGVAALWLVSVGIDRLRRRAN